MCVYFKLPGNITSDRTMTRMNHYLLNTLGYSNIINMVDHHNVI